MQSSQKIHAWAQMKVPLCILFDFVRSIYLSVFGTEAIIYNNGPMDISDTF